MKKSIVFVTFLGVILVLIILYFSSDVVRQFIQDCFDKLEKMIAGIQDYVEKNFG